MWLLAPLLCLTPLLAHIYCNDVVGIVGENFTFPVEIDQRMVEIVWKKNKDKVAEREGENNTTYYGPLHYRSVLSKDGSLTIVNLEKDDAGTYELQYWDSEKDHYLKFVLVVLDFPEPKTSCNTSNGELILNCTAHFQESLNYTWKLNNDPRSYPLQELSIPWRDVTATKATCIIKFSQTERSSEISLAPCRPEEKGDSSSKRSRGILFTFIAALLVGFAVGIPVILHRKGIIKCGAKTTVQNNSPVNDSATVSYSACCEDEEPEADRALIEDKSALKDKQIVKNGVNQEAVTQDAEGGNGEHLNDSSSYSKEDLKV